MKMIISDEANNREGSQPPDIVEEPEAEATTAAETMEAKQKEMDKSDKPKGRRLDKIVPPPPPCTGANQYRNTQGGNGQQYVNTPRASCPYDNNAHSKGGGVGGIDEPVPPKPRADPGGDGYERLNADEMDQVDPVYDDNYMCMGRDEEDLDAEVSMGIPGKPASDDYMKMDGRDSKNYMTMGGNYGVTSSTSTDDNYMNINEPQGPVHAESRTRFFPEKKLCSESDASPSVRSYWEEVVPLSPAVVMKEIRGEDPTPPPPAGCMPIPGYIHMGGNGNKTRSYVNEEIIRQQRTDEEAAALAGKQLNAVLSSKRMTRATPYFPVHGVNTPGL